MSETANPAGLPLRQRVQQVIDMIRPAIQSDGGDVELVDVDDQGVVQLRMHGACIGCPSATMTLKMGIERNLRAQVPEVSEVVCVR
ncbi:MAG TPA: NifU family protein [Phycisphaerae bacterium]|jgi:Fe-S cluster biogenesis protein NfuA|nr:NifU family protein [Phycisphaerae bacterium]HOB74868.1 NifU family protein [Phycisphaerae bacterium]HOJ53730.1 NifU family protein [Phycisphaerae bacterium]HOL27954.1 NifU family protein [Phycisphaerae bacterium]HPP22210.1 NifU family protein [Phycisphaerae bacterium]